MPFSKKDYKKEFDATPGSLLDKSMAVLAKYVGYMPTAETWVNNPLSRLSLYAHGRSPSHAYEAAAAIQECKVRIARGENVSPQLLVEEVIGRITAGGKKYHANHDLHTALLVIRDNCIAALFSSDQSRENYYQDIFDRSAGDICEKSLAMLRDYANNSLLHDILISANAITESVDTKNALPTLQVSATVRLLRSFILKHDVVRNNREKLNEIKQEKGELSDKEKLNVTSTESFFQSLQKYIEQIAAIAEENKAQNNQGDKFSIKLLPDVHLRSILIVANTSCAEMLNKKINGFLVQHKQHSDQLGEIFPTEIRSQLIMKMLAIKVAVSNYPPDQFYSHALPAIKSAAYNILTTLSGNDKLEGLIVAAEEVLHFDNPNMLSLIKVQRARYAEIESMLSLRSAVTLSIVGGRALSPKRQAANESLLSTDDSVEELKHEQSLISQTLAWLNKSAVPAATTEPESTHSASCSSTDLR